MLLWFCVFVVVPLGGEQMEPLWQVGTNLRFRGISVVWWGGGFCVVLVIFVRHHKKACTSYRVHKAERIAYRTGILCRAACRRKGFRKPVTYCCSLATVSGCFAYFFFRYAFIKPVKEVPNCGSTTSRAYCIGVRPARKIPVICR